MDLRDQIKYNSSEYTYELKNDKFLLEDIIIKSEKNQPRAICAKFVGSNIHVTYDTNVPMEKIVKGLALMNFRGKKSSSKVDLIKQLNRTIEQLNSDD